MSLLAIHHGGNRVKDECIISPDWVGEIEGGFQQSSSWVSVFEITRKLEVRNSKIDVHYGDFIMHYNGRNRVIDESLNLSYFNSRAY